MSLIIRRTSRHLVWALALVTLSLALLLSVARIATPFLNDYRHTLAQWASEQAGYDISVDRIKARWRGLIPVIYLRRVVVKSPETGAVLFTARRVDVGVNWWGSLWHRRFEPDSLRIQGAQINYQLPTEKKSLPTISSDTDVKTTPSWVADWAWLLSHPRLSVEEIQVALRTADGQTLPEFRLNLLIKNQHDQHALRGTLTFLGQGGGQIDLAVDAEGDTNDWSTLSSLIYLQLTEVDLTPWLTLLPPSWRSSQGHIDQLQLWTHWQGHQLQSAEAVLEFDAFKLNSDALTLPLIKRLQTKLWWRAVNDSDWSILVSPLSLETENGQLSDVAFKLTTARNNGTPEYHFQLPVGQLDQLPILWDLLPAGVRSTLSMEHLSALAPQGQVRGLDGHWHMRSGQVVDWKVSTTLRQAGWRAWSDIPGVESLSGFLYATPENGFFQLDSQALTLDINTLFNAPLTFEHSLATIDWQRLADEWQLIAKDIQLRNHEGQVYANLRVDIPDKMDDVNVNLSAKFANTAIIRDVLPYLPVHIMDEDLVAWLPTALQEGKWIRGSLAWQGNLGAFPYGDDNGTFQIHADFNGVQLKFLPKWPALTDLTGTFHWHERGFDVLVDEGEALGNVIEKANAGVSDVLADKPWLIVTGQVHGDAEQALNFISETPYRSTAKALTELGTVSGDLRLGLGVLVPLNTALPALYNGRVALSSGNFSLSQAPLTLSEMHGQVWFNEAGVWSHLLTGYLTEFPVLLSIDTQPQFIKTQWSSFVSTDLLQTLSQQPIDELLMGEAAYTASVLFPTAVEGDQVALNFTSDLKGMEINAPAPFAKPAQQKQPLQLHVQLKTREHLSASISYGKTMNGLFQLQKQAQGWQIAAGDVKLGARGGEPVLPSEKLTVTGNLPDLVVSQWVDFFATLKANYLQDTSLKAIGEQQSTRQELLKQVQLSLNRLVLPGLTLRALTLGLMPQDGGWNLTLKNANLAGRIEIPEQFPQGTLKINFSRLHIPELPKQANTEAAGGQEKSTEDTPLAPDDVPNLDIQIANLSYRTFKFDDLVLSAQHEQDHLQIKKFALAAPLAELKLNGYWRPTAAGSETYVQGAFTTPNYGELLKSWQLSEDIAGKTGKIDFQLNWPAAPQQIDFKILEGDMHLLFGPGRILHLNGTSNAQLGLGKILNLLSLSNISRRLSLNFSDIYKKGFSFDKIEGKIQLKSGRAMVKNLVIAGVIADIEVDGDLELVKQTYNLDVRVTPYVTSSIPVAAAIATGAVGGPVVAGAVGAAAWVANKLITPGVDQLTTYYYKVTGTWDDPVITPTKKPVPVTPPPSSSAMGSGRHEGEATLPVPTW